MKGILLEPGDYIIRKQGQYFLSNALFSHANIEVSTQEAERLIMSQKVIKQRSSGFGVRKYTQPPQQQKQSMKTISEAAAEWRTDAKMAGATNLLPVPEKKEEWYYYPAMYTETLYSNLGNSVSRKEFDAKIDSGQAVMTGRDYIAFYPGDKQKYYVGIFCERQATAVELNHHYTGLQRQLRSAATSHHYLTGQPKNYRQYLEQRIEAVKAAYHKLFEHNFSQRKAA